MNFVKQFCTFTIILISINSQANTGPAPSLIVGAISYVTHIDSNQFDKQSPVQSGFAFGVEGKYSPQHALQADFQFLNKLYFREDAGNYRLQKKPQVYINIGYRFYLIPQLSFGLGLAAAYLNGSVKDISVNGTGASLETTASDITNYSLDSSIQLQLFESNNKSLIIDYRYSFGFTLKENEDLNHSALLLAYKVKL